MSGYDETFHFNAIAGAHGMPASLDTVPAPVMDQSGTRNAAPSASSGLMEGGTAAPLHARLDFAPFEGARSNGCKCGTGFSKHSALKRHIDTKDASKTFACTLCYDKFTRKDKLKDHCRHYHKVTDEGLRALFNAQEKLRGAATRLRRAPVPLAAASSGPAPTQAPAPPPALAPAPAGPSIWSPTAYAGQQHANFSAEFLASANLLATTSPFVPTDSFGSSGTFVPAADPFVDAALVEGTSGMLDIFGDEAWTTNFGGSNF